jgi:hypothetical protein
VRPSSCANSSGARLTTRASRRRRVALARISSVMRHAATRISQPSGLSGTPFAGHSRAAATSASWTASSAAAKSP